MAEYQFSFALADQTRDRMAAVTNRIHSMLVDLDKDVSGCMADWLSDARNEYNVAKATWDEAAARMPAALGRAEQTLQSISDGYLHVEHYGIDLWRR